MSGTHVSGRALAKALGVTEGAVRTAVKTGRIKRENDGLFDLERCLADWDRNTDPGRSKARGGAAEVRTPQRKVRTATHPRGTQAPQVSPISTPAEASEAVALIAAVLRSEGVIPEGPIDYPAARLAETILKARERDLKIAERRKLLVPSAAVQRHFSDAYVGVRREFQGMAARHVPESAARLGVDPGLLRDEVDRMVAATLDEMSTPALRLGDKDASSAIRKATP